MCGGLKSNNEGYAHFLRRGEAEGRDTQRQGGRATLKDILPCPVGLGWEIDIFQSDEALM